MPAGIASDPSIIACQRIGIWVSHPSEILLYDEDPIPVTDPRVPSPVAGAQPNRQQW